MVTLQAGDAYGFDDAALSEKGKKLLDAVLGSLKDEYVFRVDVSGYTDRIGDEAYNVDLSRRRAQSAADHLIKGGIAAERIKINAMGSADPIVDCGDKAGDELIACLSPNRRTEVRFFYPRAYASEVLAVREQLMTDLRRVRLRLHAGPVDGLGHQGGQGLHGGLPGGHRHPLRPGHARRAAPHGLHLRL